MSYFTRAEIEAELPARFLEQALDDDGDGVEDAGLYDQVAANADKKVDGRLGQLFTTPFTAPVPSLVNNASVAFMLATIYRRRGYGTKQNNPWMEEEEYFRDKLDAIAKGDEPLTPEIVKRNPSVSVVAEPSRMTSSNGKVSF